MIKIGKINSLKIIQASAFAVHLDAKHLGEVKLLETPNVRVNDYIDVFLFKDTDEQLAATILIPYAELDECAFLEVVGQNSTGSFLNWNIPKDLFVPLQQQQTPMQMGYSYVVTIYLDEQTQRLAASSKLSHYLYEFSKEYYPGQPVDLLICARSELGYKAVINNTHLGLIYESDVFQALKIGQKTKGFIHNVRPDSKIDLTLQKNSHLSRASLQDAIIIYLKNHNGKSTITDKSSPIEIYEIFSVSKSNYKKAIGALYREKKIILSKQTILLNEPGVSK